MIELKLNKYENILNLDNSTPKEKYTSFIQAMLNDRWDNSTQNSYEIYKQKEIGSSEYELEPISVDMAIDMGTGLKKSDDFKLFGNKNLETKNVLGLMFIWDGEYWLTTNIRKYANPYNQIEVRRCNNELRWVNKENGAINSIPCCIDYDLSGTQPLKDKDVIVANGHIVVIVQGNDLTRNLEINQRFIFNGTPFKMTGINNMLQNNNVNENTTLLYYDLYIDMVDPEDDIKNNIANRYEFNYSISINNAPSELIKGITGTLNATVRFNGEDVLRNVIWEAENENIQINNDGEYEIIGDIETEAKVKVYISGNPDVYDEATIAIVDNIEDNYYILINPEIQEIRQGSSVSFDVNVYNNQQIVDNLVDVSVDYNDKFSLIRDGNRFTLTALKPSSKPIVITFSYGEVKKDMSVVLKSFF